MMTKLRSQWGAAHWRRPSFFAVDNAASPATPPTTPDVVIVGGAGHGVALSVRAGELLALAIERNLSLPEWGSLPR